MRRRWMGERLLLAVLFARRLCHLPPAGVLRVGRL
jgi:hypothetical protein